MSLCLAERCALSAFVSQDGHMRVREHIHSLVDSMASIRTTPPSENEKIGCRGKSRSAEGMRRVVEVGDECTRVEKNVKMDGDHSMRTIGLCR
jgi:hypothetical protein